MTVSIKNSAGTTTLASVTTLSNLNASVSLDGFLDVDDYGIIDFVLNLQGPPL